jgi:hypothetical protein
MGKNKIITYQVNVVLDFPNTSDPNGKPLQKNFAFDIEKYNFYESIPRSVINEEITKKGFDLSTVIGVAFDVRSVESKKKK